MDGVITNTMSYHYRAWKHIFLREGIDVTYEDVYCREGQKGLKSIQEISKKYGKAITLKRARRILTDKEKYFKRIVRIRFITGAKKFIKELFKKKFLLALVTGTSRYELNKILPEHILNLFSVTITSNDVTHGKPHPEPFLKSLKKLRMNQEDVVVIENAPFGIEAAKQAGLRCFALETSLPRQYLKRADAVFSSIKELQKQVKFHRS